MGDNFMKKKWIYGFVFCFFLVWKPEFCFSQPTQELKPRVIVLTDLKRVHETDDFQSMVRLLALADLIEIEGIIISSGYNYWQSEHLLEGYQLIFEIIERYGQSVHNLMKINKQTGFEVIEDKQNVGYWPSKDYLIQRTAKGSPLVGMNHVGMQHASDGSRLITNIVDQNDDRPVFVLAWGGANVLAQAIWDISENPLLKRSPEGVQTFINKLRVVSIGDQDEPWNKRNDPDKSKNSHYWMREEFPSLFWIKLSATPFAKLSNEMQPFYQTHIQGHGALGDIYPDHSNSVEGDTPSLLYMLPLGYGDPEKPETGSIIGTFVNDPNNPNSRFFVQNQDLRQQNEALAKKHLIPVWNMFAARMDWARSSTGNRPPVISVNGDHSHNILKLISSAGSEITLDASNSYDREMDKLSYHWELMSFPGVSMKDVKIDAIDEDIVKINLPGHFTEKQVHIMLTVTDDGAGHPLTAYKRIIITIQ